MPAKDVIPLFPSADPVTLARQMDSLRRDGLVVAAEHTAALLRALQDAASLSEQIAKGGQAYDLGAREVARATQLKLAALVLNLRSIVERPQVAPAEPR
jgi:hypothetical protein